MIYQYPQEFIVPVIYANDLEDKDIYRCKKVKFSHEGELLTLDNELQEYKMILPNADIHGEFQKKDISFLNTKDGFLESYNEYILKDSIAEDSLEYGNMKNIMNDIDDDYVKSETSIIHNSEYKFIKD